MFLFAGGGGGVETSFGHETLPPDAGGRTPQAAGIMRALAGSNQHQVACKHYKKEEEEETQLSAMGPSRLLLCVLMVCVFLLVPTPVEPIIWTDLSLLT